MDSRLEHKLLHYTFSFHHHIGFFHNMSTDVSYLLDIIWLNETLCWTVILAFSREFWKASLKSLQLNVITRHYTVANIKFMRFLRKNKSDYLYANFKNVLTIRWYFSYIGFSCTMLYCIRVFRVLLEVIYLPRLGFKPVNFLQACCLLIDASSSWFLG